VCMCVYVCVDGTFELTDEIPRTECKRCWCVRVCVLYM